MPVSLEHWLVVCAGLIQDFLLHGQRAGTTVSGIMRCVVLCYPERHRQATGMLLKNMAALGNDLKE